MLERDCRTRRGTYAFVVEARKIDLLARKYRFAATLRPTTVRDFFMAAPVL